MSIISKELLLTAKEEILKLINALSVKAQEAKNEYEKNNSLITSNKVALKDDVQIVSDRATVLEKKTSQQHRKLKPRMGIAEWWTFGDSRDNLRCSNNNEITLDLETFKGMGIEELSLCVHCSYGIDITSSSSTAGWYWIQKPASVLHACSECKRLGIRLGSLKFMMYGNTTIDPLNLKSHALNNFASFSTFWQTGINEFCNAVKTAGYTFDIVTVFNEFNSLYGNIDYKDFVIETIKIPQTYGYATGISATNVEEYFKIDSDIMNQMDIIAFNAYPYGSVKRSEATLEDQIQCWDNIVCNVKWAREKYPNKKMYMTETGGQDYWEMLGNPSKWSYNDDSTCHKSYGEAPALYLKGLFESEVINYIENVTYWYYNALYNTISREPYEPIKELFREYLGTSYGLGEELIQGKLTADKSSPQNVGSEITLTAVVTSEGTYQYKFLIQDVATKTWANIQDYSNNNICKWVATKSGTKNLYVDIKDTSRNITSRKSIESFVIL